MRPRPASPPDPGRSRPTSSERADAATKWVGQAQGHPRPVHGVPRLPGHPRYPGGVELVCHHAAGGVEVDPRGEREAIASGACRPLRLEREVAPGATQPRPRNGPGAAIGRSTAVRPGRAGAGAMCACRSPTAATRGRPRPALRWKTPPTDLTVGTGLGRSRRIGSGPGGAPAGRRGRVAAHGPMRSMERGYPTKVHYPGCPSSASQTSWPRGIRAHLLARHRQEARTRVRSRTRKSAPRPFLGRNLRADHAQRPLRR